MNPQVQLPSAGALWRRVCTAVLFALAAATGLDSLRAANGHPPELLTYQGYLADANGNPLATNAPVNYDVLFRIYPEQTGGTAVWAEKQTVTVDKGQFSVLLGEGAVNASELRPALSAVFAAANASDRFLDLTVTINGTALNIAPRLRLVPSPYAFLSRSAGKLVSSAGADLVTSTGAGIHVAGTIAATSITAASFAGDGAALTGLSGTQIPSLDGSKITGSVDASKISGGLGGSKIQGTIRNDSSYSGMIETLYAANDRFGIAFLATGPATAIYHSGLNTGSSIQLGKMTGASSFAPQMTISYSGYVGIGTTSPVVPLDVSGPTPLRALFGRYYDSAWVGLDKNRSDTVSIKAAFYVEAGGFVAVSDERIKDLVRRTEPGNDLRTIQQLQVTDYRMKDRVQSSHALKKGFIAQEVEQVIPEAVTRGRGTIPDIYARALTTQFDAETKALTLTLQKPHGLAPDDAVSLLFPDQQGEFKVTAVPSATAFVVTAEREPDQVFVYGRRVNDFRSVDYDRIFTTGIGAIQELARQVEDLRRNGARIAELEERASRVDGLEREVAELKRLVTGLAGLRPEARTLARSGSSLAAGE